MSELLQNWLGKIQQSLDKCLRTSLWEVVDVDEGMGQTT